MIKKDLGLQLGGERQQPAVGSSVTGLACSAFWDVENCPLPSNFMPGQLAPNILKVLKASGLPCEDVLDMHVYYDSTTKTPANRKLKKVADGSKGVGFNIPLIRDIKGGKSNKDAGDKAMIADIYGWISTHPAPANVLIISADGDFCRVTNSLRQKLYNVVVACAQNVTPPKHLLRAPLGVFEWKAMAAGNLLYYSPDHAFQPHPQPPHHDDGKAKPPEKVHVWWDHQTCPLPADKKDLMKTVSHTVKTNLRDIQNCWGPIEIEVYVDAGAFDPMAPLDPMTPMTPLDPVAPPDPVAPLDPMTPRSPPDPMTPLDPMAPLDFINHDIRFSIVPRCPSTRRTQGKEDASKMILHDMLGAMLKTRGESHFFVVVSDADVSSALGCVKNYSKHTPVVIKSPGVDFDYAGVEVWEWPTAVIGP